MTVQTAGKNIGAQNAGAVTTTHWLKIGLTAGLVSVIFVLLAQALALTLWPEAAAFRPLNSYPRTVLFTLVPALVATALFARLARGSNPVGRFVRLAAFVLLVSFIPDYALPDPNRTLLASTIAAFLHVVAALSITGILITGFHRAVRRR